MLRDKSCVQDVYRLCTDCTGARGVCLADGSSDLFLLESVDEEPDVGSDAVLAVVEVAQRALGVHALPGVHFPVLERAQDLFHGALGTRFERRRAIWVRLFQLLQRTLKYKITTLLHYYCHNNFRFAESAQKDKCDNYHRAKLSY